ncbi:hypothetical protein N8005_07280 [Litorivicinus sp.]|nr:hypothetical protein [Litorivicinus sp.]
MSDSTQIVLLGGCSGVAKSSYARYLSVKKNMIHRLGSGFIREMAKCFLSEHDCPSLYRYSFDTVSGEASTDTLIAQSIPLQPMIFRAMRRAWSEGTGLIVEGVNVIPGLTEISDVPAVRYFLHVESEDAHFKMINGETHKHRAVSLEQFYRVRAMQEDFIVRANDNGWKILDVSEGDFEAFN